MVGKAKRLRSIVTGGAGAVGGDVFEAMKVTGDDLVCLDRNPPQDKGIHFVKTDMSDRRSINAGLAAARDMLGCIDVLVHAAGIIQTTSFAPSKKWISNALWMLIFLALSTSRKKPRAT